MADETIVIEYQVNIDDFVDYFSERADWKFIFVNTYSYAVNMIKGILIGLFIVAIITYFFCITKYNINPMEILYKLIEIGTNSIFIQSVAFCAVLLTAFQCTYFIYRCSKPRLRKYYTSYFKGKKGLSISIDSEFIITKDSIVIKDNINESKYSWVYLDKIESYKSCLCFYTPLGLHYIVPARFFKSEEHKNEVFQKCQQWFSEANKEGQNVT